MSRPESVAPSVPVSHRQCGCHARGVVFSTLVSPRKDSPLQQVAHDARGDDLLGAHGVCLVPDRWSKRWAERGRGSRAEGVGQHGQITGYVSGSDLTAHAALRVFCLLWRQGGRACLRFVGPSCRRYWSVKQQPSCLLSHHPDGYVATSGLTL